MTLFKNKYRIESTRLKGWDYAAAGWYFVTLCTRGRECFFGEVVEGEARLSAIGNVAQHCWQEIPQHSPPNIRLDMFMVMPNHIHGIVVVETLHATSLPATSLPATSLPASDNPLPRISPKSGSVSVIVRSYKSAVTRGCGLHQYHAFAWQPRFFDHIIRDEPSLKNIRQYIVDNPAKWEQDKNNPANLWM